MNFWMPYLAGALIGLGAWGLYANLGRIAGISGILYAALWQKNSKNNLKTKNYWRYFFLIGLVIGGMIALPRVEFTEIHWSITAFFQPKLIFAASLVGIGTALGNGCTSGHGICGIARFSPRSLVATLLFMGMGILVASLI